MKILKKCFSIFSIFLFCVCWSFTVFSQQPLLTLPVGHNNSNMAVFSANGKQVYSVELGLSRSNIVKIWDVATGALILNLIAHSGEINSMALSPDGHMMVTTSRDKTAKIWRTSDFKLLTTLSHSREVLNANFSEDNNSIVTASEDSTAKIWDVKTGKLLFSLIGHRGSVQTASFSFKGEKIVTSSADSTAKIWDVKSGRLLMTLQSRIGALKSAAFSTDGQKILTAAVHSVAEIWDVNNGNVLRALGPLNDRLISATFTADGSLVALAGGIRTTQVYKTDDGKLLYSFHDLYQHTRISRSSVLSPDGTRILTLNGYNSASLWDLHSGALIKTFPSGNTEDVVCVAFSRDGKKLLTTSNSKLIRVWDAERFTLIGELRGHSEENWSAEFSPDGKKIYTGGVDTIVKIWDSRTGRLIGTGAGHFKMSRSDSVLSQNGRFLATCTADTVKISDLYSHTTLSRLMGHSGYIWSIAFSSNDRVVTTTSSDGSAKVWNTQTGKLIHDFRGHSNAVTSANFSLDGKRLLTASLDNTCKLWNAETGKLLYTFFAVDSTDYLITDSYGRFDGTESARKLVHFTCGTEIIGLDQIKDQLWIPDLAERILRGDSISAKKLSDLDICGLVPKVEQLDLPGYHYRVLPGHGGLGETVVSVNGIEVKRISPQEMTETTGGYELTVNESDLKSFFVAGKRNPVTVKAYTADNQIASRIALAFADETQKKGPAPNLYAVMIGVSDYKSTDMQLKYAAKDATDMSAAFSQTARKFLNADGKEHVFIYKLTTGPGHDLLPEKLAIKNLLADIGLKAGANDILFLFFAGHGVLSGESKQFYFLTSDASAETSISVPGEVGISMQDLGDWISPARIKAQKRVLIFDACNSGQAINEFIKIGSTTDQYLAVRNNNETEQIKAIDKLNEKSGLFILAASAANQNAYEIGRYTQGLLTYSLLKGMKEQPEVLEDGKYLNVSAWFNAAERTVSNLVRETGKRQDPKIIGSGNFNVGVVDQQIMASIKLEDQLPLLTNCNFQNSDENILTDNLELGALIDEKFKSMSENSNNKDLSFESNSHTPNVYLLNGRYDVTLTQAIVRIKILQDKKIVFSFESRGEVKQLDRLAAQIADIASKWISSRK